MKAVRAAKTAEEAKAKLKEVMHVLGKAHSNGILKANTASRQVSRLSSFVHKKFGKK